MVDTVLRKARLDRLSARRYPRDTCLLDGERRGARSEERGVDCFLAFSECNQKTGGEDVTGPRRVLDTSFQSRYQVTVALRIDPGPLLASRDGEGGPASC